MDGGLHTNMIPSLESELVHILSARLPDDTFYAALAKKMALELPVDTILIARCLSDSDVRICASITFNVSAEPSVELSSYKLPSVEKSIRESARSVKTLILSNNNSILTESPIETVVISPVLGRSSAMGAVVLGFNKAISLLDEQILALENTVKFVSVLFQISTGSDPTRPSMSSQNTVGDRAFLLGELACYAREMPLAKLNELASEVDLLTGEKPGHETTGTLDSTDLKQWIADAVHFMEERVLKFGIPLDGIENRLNSTLEVELNVSRFAVIYNVMMSALLTSTDEKSSICISARESAGHIELSISLQNGTENRKECDAYAKIAVSLGQLSETPVAYNSDEQIFFIQLQPTINRAQAPRRERSAQSRKILIVDDDDTLRELLQDILESRSFEVTCCPDAMSALETLTGTHYDLIVTDHGLPKMSGLEFAGESKRLYPDVPVIMITGWGTEINSTLDNSVNHILPKPFNLAALLQLVEESLELEHQP